MSNGFNDQPYSYLQYEEFYKEKILKLFQNRKKVLKEFIETEQIYVEDLTLICDIVLPIFEQGFREKEIAEIFTNIKEIIEINKKFLNALIQTIREENIQYQLNYKIRFDTSDCFGHENSKIFEVFIKHPDLIDNFKQYFDYCKKYQQAFNFRQNLYQKNQLYQKVLEESGKLILIEKQRKLNDALQQCKAKVTMRGITKQILKILHNNNNLKKEKGEIKLELIARLFMKLPNNRKQIQTNLQVVEEQLQDRFCELNLENYLSKPFQRLSKYIVLLQELKKNTPAILNSDYFFRDDQFYHPDYQNIDNSLKKFLEINQINDKEISDYWNIQKMMEIQQKFGNEKFGLINHNRRFIFEESVELVINKAIEKYLLICLNDSIILLQEEEQLFQKRKNIFAGLHLASDIRQIQELPQNRVKFLISTKQQIFHFITTQEKYQIIQKKTKLCIDQFVQERKNILAQNLEDKYDWSEAKIRVKVEGTEEYDVGTHENYTVYIIALKYENIKWKIYKRFSELRRIQNIIEENGFNQFIHKIRKQKFDWLFMHDNQRLKQNIIDIENFFESIFKIPELENFKYKIFIDLGIPFNFNLVPKFFDQQNVQQNEKLTPFFSSFLEKIDQKFQEDIKISHILSENIIFMKQTNKQNITVNIPYSICISSEKLKCGQSKLKPSNIYNFETLKQQHLAQQSNIRQANLTEKERFEKLHGFEGFKIQIDELTKAIELCEIIADSVNLKFFYDFRLLVVDFTGNMRYLDNDQIIFQSLAYNVKQALFFFKYIFFPSEYEVSLYRNDEIRLMYLTHYFLTEIKRRQYKFSLGQYSNILAMFYLMFQKLDQFQEVNIEQEIIDALIDEKTRVTYSKKVLRSLIVSQVHKYFDQFCELQKNIQPLQETTKSNTSFSKPTTQQLAHLALINLAFSIPLFSCVRFYVAINFNTNCNKYWFLQLKGFPNVYLGISYFDIKIISPTDFEELLSFPLSNIINKILDPVYLILEIKVENPTNHIKNENSNMSNTEIISLPESIERCSEVELKSQTSQIHGSFSKEKIQLKTQQGYRISQLIEEYNELKKFQN